MPGKYSDRIKALPLYNGQFDAYKLEAKDCDVLFASYPAGTSIPAHVHDTDNHGVITRGELILSIHGSLRLRQMKLNSGSMKTHNRVVSLETIEGFISFRMNLYNKAV